MHWVQTRRIAPRQHDQNSDKEDRAVYRFADGKSKSGVTQISRAAAIKLAEYEIDRVLKDRK